MNLKIIKLNIILRHFVVMYDTNIISLYHIHREGPALPLD
jgi:hypothetical protein